MISLLRRNRKKISINPNNQHEQREQPHSTTNRQAKLPQNHSNQQRPNTRNHLSDQQQQRQQQQQQINYEMFSDSSLDSLVFAASLGLVSTSNPQSPEQLMLVVQERQRQQAQNARQNARQNAKGKESPTGLDFKCQFCGKGYRWKSTMRRHEALECGNKPPSFQCPQCNYKARQRGNLTVHLKRHHQKEKEKGKDKDKE